MNEHVRNFRCCSMNELSSFLSSFDNTEMDFEIAEVHN